MYLASFGRARNTKLTPIQSYVVHLSQIQRSLTLFDRGVLGSLGAFLQELDEPIKQSQHVKPHQATHERIHAEAKLRA